MAMFQQDNIPPLVKASSTTLTLALTYLGQPTVITVGGQSYLVPATLTLNCATSGVANGLDTGSLIASSSYFVYAVVNQSTFTVALVASLTAPATGPVHPSGYGTAQQWIGGFTTDGASAIASVLQGNQVSSPISTPNLVGRTDGVTPGPNAIGQVISVNTGYATGMGNNGTYGDITGSAIVLQPGCYIAFGNISEYNNGTVAAQLVRVGLGTLSGTSPPESSEVTSAILATTGMRLGIPCNPLAINVAFGNTKTVYMKMRCDGLNTNVNADATITVVRIA